VSATQLQLLDGIVSAVGSGSFELTPFVGRNFTNSTAVGQGSVPTDSNEVVLGNGSVAKITSSATIVKHGIYPTYPDAATANAARAIGECYHLSSSPTIVHQRVA
jgi:hypothetical protein